MIRIVTSCRLSLLASLACLQLAGCSAYRPADDPAAGAEGYQVSGRAPDAVREQVVFSALGKLGRPYRYGGGGPEAFDCSGLVQFSYAQAGVAVPRTSAAQYSTAIPVKLADARPGDLLFFRYGFKVSHVGIYLGDGEFVHAPSSGNRVSVASLDDGDYRARLVRAGRLYPLR